MMYLGFGCSFICAFAYANIWSFGSIVMSEAMSDSF